MTFPGTADLPLILEAAYGADPGANPDGWTFTDISDRLVRSSDVRIRTGRTPGALSTDAGSCGFAVDNDDGDWSPLNPFSTVYPYVRLGLPMRLRYRLAVDAFGRTVSNGWGSTDDGYAWSAFGAGGTVALANFNVTSGVGTHLVPVANASRSTYLAAIAVPDVEVSVTVSLGFTNVTGGNVEPANILLRGTSISSFYTARVEITTAEAVQVKLYDPASNLLASATVAGLTHTSLQELRVKAQIIGQRFAIKVWAAAGSEPATWHATATLTDPPNAGWIGIGSGLASGNSNAPATFSYDDLLVTVGRFSGFGSNYQPSFVPTTDGDPLSVTRVTLGGRLRSLSQNAKPAKSALDRTMSGYSLGGARPIALWSMQDGENATQFTSSLSGGAPLQLQGPALAVDDSLIGSLPLPTFDGIAFAEAPLPAYTDTGEWTAQIMIRPDSPAPGPWASVVSVETAGGKVAGGILADTGQLVLAWWTDPEASTAGTQTTDFFADLSQVQNQWLTLVLRSVQDSGGGADTVAVTVYDATGVFLLSLSDTTAIGFHGAATAVNVSGNRNGVGCAGTYGHLGIWADPAWNVGTDDVNNARAMGGWDGELPTDRLTRLGREEGVVIDIVTGGSTQPMGPQPVSTFLDLARECAAVDGGFLGEQVDGFGLSYVPLAARINRDVDMTIDLSAYNVTSGESATVLAPTYDDQGIANEVTASRPEGSSATVADAVHIAAHGRYDTAVTRNVQSDDQLPHQAGWQVNLGTVDRMRYPNTPVNVHANLDLLMAWLGLRPGLSRVVRTGLPAKHGTGDEDRALDYYSETMQPRRWTGDYDGTPSAPLQIAVYDSGSRYGARTTYLAEDLTAVETAADVDAGTDVWATTASHPSRFPFDVTIGGLVYSCTGITGTAPNYTLTLVRVADDRTHLTGTQVFVGDARFGL